MTGNLRAELPGAKVADQGSSGTAWLQLTTRAPQFARIRVDDVLCIEPGFDVSAIHGRFRSGSGSALLRGALLTRRASP
jgi:hypothetical protein